MLRLLALLLLISSAVVAAAQKPADVLAARIKKETGFTFTYTAPHQKTNAKWAVVVLHIKPSEGPDKPKALGILEKKKGAWVAFDYFVGTDTRNVLIKMQKGHKNVPKSLFPKKF